MPDKKTYGEKKSYGAKKSYGDKKSFGERKSYGDKPAFGERKSYGDKPAFGERKSYGDKPAYGGERKSYGDKPAYGGERKSYGDKPSYGGDKPRYGERKSYGDKPAYGDRKPYERKKYATEVTNNQDYPRDYAKRDMVQFKLEEDPLDSLQTLAKTRGVPVGVMVRDWVLERLAAETGGGAPVAAKTTPAVTEPETNAQPNNVEERLCALEKRMEELETTNVAPAVE